jgi:hypothetical protein
MNIQTIHDGGIPPIDKIRRKSRTTKGDILGFSLDINLFPKK